MWRDGEGCYFLVFVQLFEKYGTLIERNTALIEKVSPCRALSRSRADGADPEPQRAARKPRAKARSATPAPRAGLRQSRRIAGRAEVDGSAAETETDPNRHASSSDSDSDCDEDWCVLSDPNFLGPQPLHIDMAY
eukprot:SAG31_NODE_155_length_22130_cov_9.540098_18_plen_135_part_00